MRYVPPKPKSTDDNSCVTILNLIRVKKSDRDDATADAKNVSFSADDREFFSPDS